MIVVDVGVLAYLLIQGVRTAEVQEVLRRDPEWAAPLSWRGEWRSVLTGYQRRGLLTQPAALERAALAQRLVRSREYVLDEAVVLPLCAQSQCSAYACEYVALATMLDVPLVTNAGDLHASFPERAVSPADYLRAAG